MASRRLIPALNRVLVEKIVPPSKTLAGILLPDKANKLNSGKVVGVGPGSHNRSGKFIPVSLKEGDIVLLPEFGGIEVKLGDKEVYPGDNWGYQERVTLKFSTNRGWSLFPGMATFPPLNVRLEDVRDSNNV